MKLFKTTDMQVVEVCREQFDFARSSAYRNFVIALYIVTTDLVKFFLV